MARSHGRLLTRIWSDDDFRGLTVAAQRAYMLLLSQPNLTHAGTIPLTIRRWATMAGDSTEADMIDALKELERRRYLAIDGHSEELLVRTLIRNDDVWKQPKVFKSAKRDAEAIASRKLRRVLVAELRSLPVTNTEVAADRDALVATLTDPDPDPPETVSDTPGQELAIPQANVPCSAGAGSPTPAPFPSHSPPVPALAAPDGTEHERAAALTDSYYQAVKGMCKWPAVLGIVKKAIKTEAWPDPEIHAALQRLAGDDRPVTTDSLRIELNGFGSRSPTNSKAAKNGQHISLVQELQERGA